MDALGLAFSAASFDGACSSHLIEHFTDPEPHVAELARVVKDDGLVCVLTPNKPADFENPFHLHLFDRAELRGMLERHFAEVWLGGVDAVPHVKADFEARRSRRRQLLRLDVFDLRHRMPYEWYVWMYTLLLPLGLQVGGAQRHGGVTGITADDWFVTDDPDETTLVLLAVARKPLRDRASSARGRSDRRHRVGEVGRRRPAGRAGRVLIDADQVARDVVAPGGPAYQPLIDHFGPGILAADGTIDRKALAAVAFADEETRLELNNITHPAIGIAMIQAADAFEAPMTSSSWPSRCSPPSTATRSSCTRWSSWTARPTSHSSVCSPSAASTGPMPRPHPFPDLPGGAPRRPTTCSTTRATGPPSRSRWPSSGVAAGAAAERVPPRPELDTPRR